VREKRKYLIIKEYIQYDFVKRGGEVRLSGAWKKGREMKNLPSVIMEQGFDLKNREILPEGGSKRPPSQTLKTGNSVG